MYGREYVYVYRTQVSFEMIFMSLLIISDSSFLLFFSLILSLFPFPFIVYEYRNVVFSCCLFARIRNEYLKVIFKSKCVCVSFENMISVNMCVTCCFYTFFFYFFHEIYLHDLNSSSFFLPSIGECRRLNANFYSFHSFRLPTTAQLNRKIIHFGASHSICAWVCVTKSHLHFLASVLSIICFGRC